MRTSDAFEQSLAKYLVDLEAQRKEILDAGKDTPYDQSLPTREDILSDIEAWSKTDLDDGIYANNWAVTENYNSERPFGCKVYQDPFDPFGELCVAAVNEKVVQYVDSTVDPRWQSAQDPKQEASAVTIDLGKRDGDFGYLAVHNTGVGTCVVKKFYEKEWGDACIRAAVAKAWGVDDLTLKQARNISLGSIDFKQDTVTAESFLGSDNLVFKDAYAFAMESDRPCYIAKDGFRDIGYLERTFNGPKYKLSECFTFNYQNLLDIAHGKREVAQAILEQANGEYPELTYKSLGTQKIAELCAEVNIEAGYEILEYMGNIPFSHDSQIDIDIYYAYSAEVYVAYMPPTTDPLGELDVNCLVEPDAYISKQMYLTGTLGSKTFVELGPLVPFKLDSDTRLRLVSTDENRPLPEYARKFNSNASFCEATHPHMDLIGSNGEVLQHTPGAVYRGSSPSDSASRLRAIANNITDAHPSAQDKPKQKNTIANWAREAKEHTRGNGSNSGPKREGPKGPKR